MIYLDNAATTFPKPEAVYKAMDVANRELAVNAGRGSYKLARQASQLIVETKQKLRELVHAEINVPVIFTPSITLAMNQIVNGIELREGAVVYVSPYEHNAVARCIHKLAQNKKLRIKEIPIDDTLKIDIEKMKYEFSKDKPEIVFCTHISNVTGYILPASQIFEEAKKHGAVTVLDTAQSLGLIDVDCRKLNADIIAFAGHKSLYGPLGIGGFINISSVYLKDFLVGGTGSDSLNLEMPNGAEGKYEFASSNIVAIAGIHSALCELDQKKIFEHEEKLTQYLIEKLTVIRELKIFSYDSNEQIGIVSFISSEMNSEDIGIILDEEFDIAVRTGYHCAPFIHKYLKDESALGTVRIGISQYTSKKDIDALIEAIKDL